MEDLVESIKKRWLKWESLPFVFAILLTFYVGLASEVNDWVGVIITGTDYLLLALPFVAAFMAYLIWCIVAHARSKNVQDTAPADGETAEPEKHSSKKQAWLVTGICLAAVAVILSVFVFFGGSGLKDGDYVIWAQEYHMALSPEVVKKYYLAGDAVQAKGSELTDYTARCVVQLDFEKDGTFTISYEGKLLGSEPGKNGIGYREECSCNVWMLEEVGDGVYYIKNVENETYLKWFAAKENWTTHPNIVDDNREQYLLYLTPAK